MKKKKSDLASLVKHTGKIAHCMKTDLGAILSKHRKHILRGRMTVNGSLDLDHCLKKDDPNSNRWDYLVVVGNQKAVFVEPHTVSTGEVRTILKKFYWLKDFIRDEIPELLETNYEKKFYWLSSGKFKMIKDSPQFRKIVKTGLKPVNKVYLDD